MRLVVMSVHGTELPVERLNPLGRQELARQCHELLAKIGLTADAPVVRLRHCPSPLVSLADLAKLLRVDRKTVERWMREAGVSRIKGESKTAPVRYRRNEVEAWLIARPYVARSDV